MLPTTTFRKLRVADACRGRYRRLAKKLGGIKAYGKDTPITLLQILEHNGADDTLWAINHSIKTTPELDRILRLFACDCAERALMRERETGLELDNRSWDAVAVLRLYADGKATDEELTAAWEAARDAAYHACSAKWLLSWAVYRAADISESAACPAWDVMQATYNNAGYTDEEECKAEEKWQTQRLIHMLEEAE
jgi:hypothetical protein